LDGSLKNNQDVLVNLLGLAEGINGGSLCFQGEPLGRLIFRPNYRYTHGKCLSMAPHYTVPVSQENFLRMMKERIRIAREAIESK
jgi:hypothetical protein